MQRFWVVLVEDTTGGTHHQHPTYDSARDEAERLARQSQNRGRKVFVLEAVNYCEAMDVPVQWFGFIEREEVKNESST